MTSLAMLESTLERLDRQGRELLERAYRHSPDWSHVASYQTSSSSGRDTRTPFSMGKETHTPVSMGKETHTPVSMGKETHTPFPSGKDTQTPVMMPKRPLKFYEAFTTLAQLSAHMTHQCQGFYNSDSLTELTDMEKRHISRFHAQPPAVRSRKHSHHEEVVEETEEGVLIDVSPGLYAITAQRPPSPEQTQVVRVTSGESATLAFNL